MFLTLITLSLFLQILLFIPAYLIKTDKLTDFSYSLGFVGVGAYAFVSGGRDPLHLLLFIMILLWAIRLGGYLVYRISLIGRDVRFDKIRIDLLKFLQFWLFQGLVIPFILTPSVMFFQKEAVYDIWMVLGGLTWAVGLLIETFADVQKFNFKKSIVNAGKWIDVGLWRYSRHPNYLGEIMCWVGIYIYTIGQLNVLERAVGLVSPLVILIILVFVSGIPILEKKADEKWKGNKKYLEYKKHTAVLIPFIY